MKFLFWNIQKKDSFFDTIFDIFIEHSIDVIGLAEFPLKKIDVIISLFKNKGVDIEWIRNVNSKVQVFRRKGEIIYQKFEGESVHATEAIIGGDAYSIVFCHLAAKNMSSGCDQENRARIFCDELLKYETSVARHNNTIVAGDFNMNPFDNGMVSASAFNAMNSIIVANRGVRKLDGKHYLFFYNPSWNLFGDKGKEVPAASFYFGKADYAQFYWHLFDQVLFRPNVFSHFDFKDFKIRYAGVQYNLLKADKTIDDILYSDHLPITFTII